MGNGTSRVVGCLVPSIVKDGVDIDFSGQLDEGLGHSFCYVRPSIFDSPAITPSNSERFTVDSSTLDSETLSGSFRQDVIDDSSGLHRFHKTFPETTFKTISGASVSANVTTARMGNPTVLFAGDSQDATASFDCTASFAAVPLQPVRGSGFMSGPLERGFASGPLERGGSGFMSGPIERGVMSGPLDATDRTFSAPLARGRKRPRFQRFLRSFSGPMKSTLSRTLSKHSMATSWMQRFFVHPVTRLSWQSKESKFRTEALRNCPDGALCERDYGNGGNLQWAHAKAGEDRVQVVLSEEQGWLFIGIYDGFSGPDAPDFLMGHLYKAIDKELEGVLWDYEDKSLSNSLTAELPESVNAGVASECSKKDKVGSHPGEAISCSEEESCMTGMFHGGESSNPDIIKKKDEVKEVLDLLVKSSNMTGVSVTDSGSDLPAKLHGQGRKSKRLYELLQMESWDGKGSVSISDCETQTKCSSACQNSQDNLDSREISQEDQVSSCSLNSKGDNLCHRGGDPTTSGADARLGPESVDQDAGSSDLGQRQSSRKSMIGSKIRKMYRKQKSLRKKLFPWSYDWHREETCVDDKAIDFSGPIRRCKSGVVDHDAVLRAMARAIENTEGAYMDMVESSLDTNAELALMGSCVLVMLMKDQDVYVMNLGDSRVILAQERQNDRNPNSNFSRDDLRHRNRSRESLVRMELDRISEESPIHSQNCQVNMVNKNRDISICRLKMRAVQLSTDHSTSVEEEVSRIRGEHPDDSQAILNDRVKGQLKVTRAFGAGFLKKPTCNDALLKVFRVAYVGTGPYVSCIPSLRHHRLSSSDRFLVLSSDGLYEYFSNEEVVAHVTWFMENLPEGDPAQYLIEELLFRAAKKNGMNFQELLDIPHGDRRKYHDDVSVMVVSLEGRIWKSSG